MIICNRCEAKVKSAGMFTESEELTLKTAEKCGDRTIMLDITARPAMKAGPRRRRRNRDVHICQKCVKQLLLAAVKKLVFGKTRK
jgi:hypothetical protein